MQTDIVCFQANVIYTYILHQDFINTLLVFSEVVIFFQQMKKIVYVTEIKQLTTLNTHLEKKWQNLLILFKVDIEIRPYLI